MKRGLRLLAIASLLSLAAPFAAQAVQPDEMLPDAKLEQRARGISSGIRCMVCQNENIDDSEAPLARDLRLLVRDRLKKGDTDDQVRAYLVARYGDFVLLKPPFKLDTLLLWITPGIVLLGGAAFAFTRMRAKKPAEATALSESERAELARLVASDDGETKSASQLTKA